MAKANPVNLQSENLIECLLKRKGGTIVNFGFHNKKKSVYHFRPLDLEDPESPHVCEVNNEEHYQRFLNIQEAYRPFNPDEEYEPVMQAPLAPEMDDYDPRNNFDDLLSVNPEDVSNEWLGQFAEKVLGLTIRQKQELADMATTQYGLEFEYKTETAVDIARMILVERIKLERNASESY